MKLGWFGGVWKWLGELEFGPDSAASCDFAGRLSRRRGRGGLDQGKLLVATVLADGRRASALILSATTTGRAAANGNPILRLHLELTAPGERLPWRVRIETAVPMTAVPMMELGQRIVVAYLAVDLGGTVAVDWPESLPTL